MTTRAIKGAEVGFSNSLNADSLTGVRKILREKRSQQNSKVCTRRGPPQSLIDTDKWCVFPTPDVTQAHVVCLTLPSRGTQVRACLNSTCLRSVRATSRWNELPGKTKHAPSRSPVLYWCRSVRVAEEQLHPIEVLTHIQCE